MNRFNAGAAFALDELDAKSPPRFDVTSDGSNFDSPGALGTPEAKRTFSMYAASRRFAFAARAAST